MDKVAVPELARAIVESVRDGQVDRHDHMELLDVALDFAELYIHPGLKTVEARYCPHSLLVGMAIQLAITELINDAHV